MMDIDKGQQLIASNCVGRLGIHWSIRGTGLRGALLAQIDPLSLELLTSLATTTASCTAGAELDGECEQAESRSNPHKH